MSTVTTPQRMRISVDRFEKMVERGVLTEYDRVELIDGDMINEPPINPPHSAVTARLTKLFNVSAGDSATVSPAGAVRLGDYSLPQPDLMVLLPRTDFYWERRPVASDILLLIEVSDSSLAYDQSIKRALYARFGVAEYWVVDVQGRRVYVYSGPAGDDYTQVRECDTADSVSPRALAGVRVEVGTLFG